MSLKVGCGSFAVSRERYFATLPTVEVGSAFIEPPRLATAQAWRQEAPKSFEFSVPASQLITHQATSSGYARILAKIPERRRPACGHFRDSPEVAMAWESTRALAAALRAPFILFETPASFYADANHLRDMYRFFKAAPRGGVTYVWQPRGVWEPRLVAKVCADLALLRARDPFEEPPETARASSPRYYRLRGVDYTEAQRAQLRRWGDGDAPTYVYFTARRGWLEARALVEGRRPDVRHLRRL